VLTRLFHSVGTSVDFGVLLQEYLDLTDIQNRAFRYVF
jgi:hypothetical protein